VVAKLQLFVPPLLNHLLLGVDVRDLRLRLLLVLDLQFFDEIGLVLCLPFEGGLDWIDLFLLLVLLLLFFLLLRLLCLFCLFFPCGFGVVFGCMA
jgi:hypothetical protein